MLIGFLEGAIAQVRRQWRRLAIWLKNQPNSRKINRRRRGRIYRRHRHMIWIDAVGLIIVLAGIMWAMMFINIP